MKYMWMLLFLLLPFMGMAYVGWHVWTLVPLSRLMRTVIIVIGVASFLLMFINFSRVSDRLPLTLARLCYDIGNSSIFILLYLTLIFLVLDLGRLLHLVPKEWLYHNFYTTATIVIGIFVLFLLGNIQYRHKVRETLELTTTKPIAKPMRIVMMSDLHLGYHNPRKEFSHWVEIINREKPDVVLIAGDIIDKSVRPLIEEDMAEEFRRIKAPVYACLGNHEYYAGEPLAQQFYKDAGINLLRDSCAIVGDLLIIGRDDRTNPHRKALGKIVGETDSLLARHKMAEAFDAGKRQLLQAGGKGKTRNELFTILLDHQPHHLEQAERTGIDFQFSGHTHRGQVWPISWITDNF